MKPRKPIRRMSAKKRRERRAFDKVVAFVTNWCQVRVPGICVTKPTDRHHRVLKSQGGKDTEENIVWCCRPCHNFLHDNRQWATEKGFIESNPAKIATAALMESAKQS